MIETRRVKNIASFFKVFLSFVLSRNNIMAVIVVFLSSH